MPRTDHRRAVYDVIKRALDVAAAAVLIALTAPAAAMIGLIVKLDSAGPALYMGRRAGLGGRPFRMRKFRTMVERADRMGGPSTADDDPRITRVGRWLRKTKLDELPQLWNVLEGDMSLVGPRPEVPAYAALLRGPEREILDVRPGMTDWASVWNFDEGALLKGSPDPERVYLEKIRPEKVRLQLKYVRERSPWVDAKILWLTAWKLAAGGRA